MAKTRAITAALGTVIVHGAFAWWAFHTEAPEAPEDASASPAPIRVRTVERRKPKPAPEPVVVLPAPDPPPQLEPVQPLPILAEAPKVVEPVADAKPQESKPKPKRKRKRRKKRSGGKTVTSKQPTARPTTVPDGRGRVLDYGQWDPNAGQGESKPAPEEPAAPATAEAPSGPSGDGAGSGGEKKRVRTRGKLVPPDPMSRPRGKYPPGVLRAAQPVNVVLSVRVDARGRVASVRVVTSGGPLLDKEAQRLAKKVRFRPATRGGVAVPMTIPWTVTFK